MGTIGYQVIHDKTPQLVTQNQIDNGKEPFNFYGINEEKSGEDRKYRFGGLVEWLDTKIHQ